MKQFVLLSLTCLTLWGCKQAPHKEAPFKMIDQVDFSQVHIQDNFWSPRLKKHISTTLPVWIDQIENQTGRIPPMILRMRQKGKGNIPVFSLMILMYTKRWKAWHTV